MACGPAMSQTDALRRIGGMGKGSPRPMNNGPPYTRVAPHDRQAPRYSVVAIAREAKRHHSGWAHAWASPEPRARYDAIIVGAGGRGLATAYYLGKNHGLTNVAVIEKGWLGGGNTTIIRSNYLQES